MLAFVFTRLYIFCALMQCACLSACQYDMVGPEGIVESHQITRDGKAGAAEAVDCKWYIRAPPRSKVGDIRCALSPSINHIYWQTLKCNIK